MHQFILFIAPKIKTLAFIFYMHCRSINADKKLRRCGGKPAV